MNQSRKHLNNVLDFLVQYHGIDSDSDSVPSSLDIPKGLGDMYRKHTDWTTDANFHSLFWSDNLAVSDGAIYRIECPKGLIGFAQEHQGVWLAACPPSTEDDTEITICWGTKLSKMPSLNHFLVWLLLQESTWVAKHGDPLETPIDDDDFWLSRGFSPLIDSDFDDDDGVIQLYRKFRLSDDGLVIASGDSHGSHLCSMSPIVEFNPPAN